MLFFKTHAEFIAGIEANTGLKWPSIQPSIQTAQLRYIKPILGAALYDSLLTEMQDTEVSDLTSPKQALAIRIQNALRRLSLYIYAPLGEIQLTDAGMMRTETNNQKSAFKYQTEAYQKAQLDMGFELLEELIDYMDSHAGDYSTWTSTDEYKFYKSLFIKTGAQLQLHCSSIRYPRRLFLLLRSTMLTVQQTIIKEAITADIFDALIAKNQSTTPNFTDEEKELLDKLKPAIANFTIARGLPTLLSTLDENGLHVLNSNSDNASSVGKRAAAPDSITSLLLKTAENTATVWLDMAVDYIKSEASESVFTSWYDANLTKVAASDFNDTASGSFSM